MCDLAVTGHDDFAVTAHAQDCSGANTGHLMRLYCSNGVYRAITRRAKFAQTMQRQRPSVVPQVADDFNRGPHEIGPSDPFVDMSPRCSRRCRDPAGPVKTRTAQPTGRRALPLPTRPVSCSQGTSCQSRMAQRHQQLQFLLLVEIQLRGLPSSRIDEGSIAVSSVHWLMLLDTMFISAIGARFTVRAQ